MPWRLKPGHQQAWYWSPKPEYSVSSISRVKTNDPQIIADNFNDFCNKIVMNLSKHMAHTTKKVYYQFLNYTILTSWIRIRGKIDCKCARNQNIIRSWWDINKAPEIFSPGQIKPLTSISTLVNFPGSAKIYGQHNCRQLSFYLSTSMNNEGIWKSGLHSTINKQKMLFMKDNSD